MTEPKSSQIGVRMNAHTENTGSESDARTLIQEEADEQIKTFVTPLIKHVKNLTRSIQGMSSVHRQNLPPRASNITNSSAADKLSDI